MSPATAQAAPDSEKRNAGLAKVSRKKRDLMLSYMVEAVRTLHHPNQFSAVELKKIREFGSRTIDIYLLRLVEDGLLARGGEGASHNTVGYQITEIGYKKIEAICKEAEGNAKELIRRALLPTVAVREVMGLEEPTAPVYRQSETYLRTSFLWDIKLHYAAPEIEGDAFA